MAPGGTASTPDGQGAAPTMLDLDLESSWTLVGLALARALELTVLAPVLAPSTEAASNVAVDSDNRLGVDKGRVRVRVRVKMSVLSIALVLFDTRSAMYLWS